MTIMKDKHSVACRVTIQHLALAMEQLGRVDQGLLDDLGDGSRSRALSGMIREIEAIKNDLSSRLRPTAGER